MASWFSRLSGHGMIWVLGAVLVSAGAGATTAAVINPPGAVADAGTNKLTGEATIVSNQSIKISQPALTNPGPDFAPLPADWKAFARINNEGSGFQASVRAPYGSTVTLHLPISSTSTADVPMILNLKLPQDFHIEVEPSEATAAKYGNVVGASADSAWYLTVPAKAGIELLVTVQLPMTTGVFQLDASLEALK